jgi:hypothetical protein
VDVRSLSLALVLTAVLALPASAVALPEGNSGIEEYIENVPGAGGDRPSDGGGANGGGSGGDQPSGGSPLSPDARAALEDQGGSGAAAADLAAATAPSPAELAGGGTNGRASSGGDGGDAAASARTGTGIDHVVGAAVGHPEGGMGIAFPIILAAVLLATVLGVVARHRRRTETTRG